MIVLLVRVATLRYQTKVALLRNCFACPPSSCCDCVRSWECRTTIAILRLQLQFLLISHTVFRSFSELWRWFGAGLVHVRPWPAVMRSSSRFCCTALREDNVCEVKILLLRSQLLFLLISHTVCAIFARSGA